MELECFLICLMWAAESNFSKLVTSTHGSELHLLVSSAVSSFQACVLFILWLRDQVSTAGAAGCSAFHAWDCSKISICYSRNHCLSRLTWQHERSPLHWGVLWLWKCLVWLCCPCSVTQWYPAAVIAFGGCGKPPAAVLGWEISAWQNWGSTKVPWGCFLHTPCRWYCANLVSSQGHRSVICSHFFDSCSSTEQL